MNIHCNLPENLKVEKFLELKKSGRGLVQKLQINHGEGIFTDEWFPVSFGVNGIVNPVLQNHRSEFDWNTVNWDKSSRELELELNQGYQKICAMRKIFGHPKLGNARYRSIDWKALDWSKNDGQLSGELKVEQGVVRNFRDRLFNAPSERGNRVVTEEMIASVTDWENTKDITLARLWSVTRERVRQLRQARGFPRCVATQHVLDDDSEIFRKWLKDHRAEIEGKLASVVARMPEFKLPDIARRLQLMKQSDISFVWIRAKKSETLANTMPVDWGLPSWVLGMIWNKCTATFANTRCRYQKQKPVFGGPFINKKKTSSQEMVSRVMSQITEAEKFGIKPRKEELKKFNLL